MGQHKPAMNPPQAPHPADDSAPFVDDYLAYLLARASHRVSAEFHAEVAAHGLSVLEWRVLASLAGNGPLAVRDLCERVLAQQPTVTKLLDRLQAQGLLQREDSPTDRRQTLVRLSPAGTERVAPLLTLAKAHEDRVLARLGRSDSQRLKKLLQGLIKD